MNLKKLPGAKFTSHAPLLGWRHFHVVSVRRGETVEVELASSVEPVRRVWVSVEALKTDFDPGWAPREQLS